MTHDEFTVGERVQLHPATDLWMRGCRYGTVTRIGRTAITVTLDATNRSVRFAPRDLQHL